MQFDNDYLEKVGLGAIPEDQKSSFLHHLQSTLEIRIGQSLSQNLTPAQLQEFDSLAATQDKTLIRQWIAEHCPNYKDIVHQQLEQLTAEILSRQSEILQAFASSTNAA